MPKIAILIGGGAGDLYGKLFKNLAKVSRTKRMLVIPWGIGKDHASSPYERSFLDCFARSGFKEVLVLELSDSKTEIERKMDRADVIYFSGGDSNWIYEEVKKRKLDKKLKRFKGILVGDSAGAIAIAKGEYSYGEFCKGLGLIDFYTAVHFELGSRNFPINKKRSRPAIYVPEGSWVAVKE